jgi:hypothetical protein
MVHVLGLLTNADGCIPVFSSAGLSIQIVGIIHGPQVGFCGCVNLSPRIILTSPSSRKTQDLELKTHRVVQYLLYYYTSPSAT